MNVEKLVESFCDAWSCGDVDAIISAFSKDAVWDNIPEKGVLAGVEAIRPVIEDFLAAVPGGIQFEIKQQLAMGNVVMHERVDTFKREGVPICARVCGVFELNDDGKISVWRDYYDRQQFAGG